MTDGSLHFGRVPTMKKWLRRIRGAVGLGLIWAVSWTVVGMALMVIADSILPGFDADVVDLWVPIFAYPAFLGGVAFSGVLGIVGGRRRFEELSLPRFAMWGAIGGLLVSLFPAAMVAAGLARPTGTGLGVWLFTAVVCVPMTVLSAGSAAGSLALARRAEGRAQELLGSTE